MFVIYLLILLFLLLFSLTESLLMRCHLISYDRKPLICQSTLPNYIIILYMHYPFPGKAFFKFQWKSYIVSFKIRRHYITCLESLWRKCDKAWFLFVVSLPFVARFGFLLPGLVFHPQCSFWSFLALRCFLLPVLALSSFS